MFTVNSDNYSTIEQILLAALLYFSKSFNLQRDHLLPCCSLYKNINFQLVTTALWMVRHQTDGNTNVIYSITRHLQIIVMDIILSREGVLRDRNIMYGIMRTSVCNNRH